MERNRNAGSHRKEAFLSTRELCREWAALYEEARRIEADSSMLTVLWKVSKFLFNEGNPVGLLLMLFYLNANETGVQAYTHLIINIFWSFSIAYYLCSEKREICLERQGRGNKQFFHDVLYKTCSLLIDWIHEWKRGEKKRKKIRAIEDHIYRTREGVWSLKKKGCIEMTKLFSSRLRYLREDILIASLRSFSLVVYHMWRMTDYDRSTLTIRDVSDVFKLLFMGCTLLKITITVKSFHDARRMYYGVQLLWGKTWKASLADDSSIDIPAGQYSSLQAFQRDFICPGAIIALDFFKIFSIVASRFLQALIIIVAVDINTGLLGYFLGQLVVLVVLLNIFMECVRDSSGVHCRGRTRAVFDNPPTGYARENVHWIDKCMAVIFFDNGYATIHVMRAVRSIFFVLSTIIFIKLCFSGSAHQDSLFHKTYSHTSNLDVKISMLFNVSRFFNRPTKRCIAKNFENTRLTSSLGIWQTLNHKLNSKQIDVLSYIGGVRVVSGLAILVPFVGYILDVLYHSLHKRENIGLQIFDRFPLFDAADLYRSLIINIVGQNAYNENDDPPDHSVDGQNMAIEMRQLNDPVRINRVIEKHLRVLMSLTILETEDFNKAWRRFTKYSLDSGCWVNFIVDLALAEENWSDILQETERRHGIQINEIFSFNNFSNGNNADSSSSSDLNPSLVKLKNLATRIIDKFQGNDHPLQPYANGMETKGLLRGMHAKIQNVSSNQILNFKLFIKFCNALNERLLCMTSSRIEQTFEMSQQVLKKTYE